MTQKLLNLLILLSCTFSFSQTIVINEIDADNPSSDTKEFIELRSMTPNFSLDGYVIVLYNEGTVASYNAFDLDGYTTDANGIVHFGNSAVVPSPSIILSSNYFQNGPDVAALYMGSSLDFPYGTAPTTVNLVDAIAYSSSNTTTATNLMSALNITVSTPDIETSTSTSKSIQRKNDGTYEVKIPTPGVPNDGSGIVFNYLTVTTSQTSYNEGDSFNITFTTSQPVENETLIMNFSLTNGNFSVGDFGGGTTVSIPVGQTTGQTAITIYNDGSDEGDEEALFQFAALPSGYLANNDNFIIRVYDVNFSTDPWGTPLNPTYGDCTPQIPAGYYDNLNGLSGPTLKQAIQDIIADPAEVRLQSYADIWDILKEADRNPENNNQVWTIYREEPMAKLDQQNTSSIVGKWNREHIFCQSRGGFEVALGDTADGINVWNSTGPNSTSDGVSDAHHIRAVNGQENSSRNNKNYGEVATGTVYAGPTGTQGSWKGDVARALFYMAVRFNGLNVVNGDPSEYMADGVTPSGEIGDLATLLNWNTQDPADDYEMNRNNVIYNWQHNRNPFIDMPLLADYVFGSHYGDEWNNALVNESFTTSSIKVYPNPTTNYLVIDGFTGNIQVEIYNITGQKVLEQTIFGTAQIHFNLEAGIYYVKSKNAVGSSLNKVIVK
ncbi:endonuclease [Flavobacterium haoranii]|uniref:Por secretion system C-terminal sorting domain-containing protein n=1 Tax=Flavobacterium haoranii TaxID=683124 RepID=A0A1M6LYV5_9FLAO|nr:endonuclease [Flavobacterium haoranii]SHJ76428.1 Por secretion system C-terminal sorting domain-containing protein [Flavobacterium haoranii]